MYFEFQSLKNRGFFASAAQSLRIVRYSDIAIGCVIVPIFRYTFSPVSHVSQIWQLYTGVSILQENLICSPALCVVCKILPEIFPQLQKLQVHFNQGRRLVFDMGGMILCCVQGGVWGGMCPPQKLEIFVFFETRIVQFDEYFWVQN